MSPIQISDEDITYITTTILPVVEKLTGLAGADEQAGEALDAIKGLVTPEMLTIMQLMGFNFREQSGNR